MKAMIFMSSIAAVLFSCESTAESTGESEEITTVRDSVDAIVYVNRFENEGIRYICFSERNQSNTQFMIDQAYYLQGDTVDFCGRTWVALTPTPTPIETIKKEKIPTIE